MARAKAKYWHLTNVDLVAIQSSDPRAQIFNSQIFGQSMIFPQKYSEACEKLTPKDRTLNHFVNGHK